MIQTTRCQLTTIQTSDRDFVIKLYTNEEVRQFLGGVVDEKTISQKFSQMLESNSKMQHWIVRVKENNLRCKAGIVSLGKHHNEVDTEVSYQFLPLFWHQGYATEAVKAVITYAFSVWCSPRVIAETQLANVASCRLLKRIGMDLAQTVDRFGATQGIFTTYQD